MFEATIIQGGAGKLTSHVFWAKWSLDIHGYSEVKSYYNFRIDEYCIGHVWILLTKFLLLRITIVIDVTIVWRVNRIPASPYGLV